MRSCREPTLPLRPTGGGQASPGFCFAAPSVAVPPSPGPFPAAFQLPPLRALAHAHTHTHTHTHTPHTDTLAPKEDMAWVLMGTHKGALCAAVALAGAGALTCGGESGSSPARSMAGGGPYAPIPAPLGCCPGPRAPPSPGALGLRAPGGHFIAAGSAHPPAAPARLLLGSTRRRPEPGSAREGAGRETGAGEARVTGEGVRRGSQALGTARGRRGAAGAEPTGPARSPLGGSGCAGAAAALTAPAAPPPPLRSPPPLPLPPPPRARKLLAGPAPLMGGTNLAS